MEREPSAGTATERGRPRIACPACRAAVPLVAGSGRVGSKTFQCPRCGTEFSLDPDDLDR